MAWSLIQELRVYDGWSFIPLLHLICNKKGDFRAKFGNGDPPPHSGKARCCIRLFILFYAETIDAVSR